MMTGKCTGCGHPYALHGNGTTACKAFACTSGPSAQCPDCGGTTFDLVAGGPCARCEGRGSVAGPCQAFAQAELKLAS